MPDHHHQADDPPKEPPHAGSTLPSAAHARLIGERVRAARHAAHLTQQELGGTTFSKSYLSAVECGKMTPSVPALSRLAERLGVTPAYLLGETSTLPPSEGVPAPEEDDEQATRLREAERVLQEGRYEAAIALFEQSGQRDRTSEAYEQYALLLAAQGRYQDAYAQMQRAIHSRR